MAGDGPSVEEDYPNFATAPTAFASSEEEVNSLLNLVDENPISEASPPLPSTPSLEEFGNFDTIVPGLDEGDGGS